LKGLLSALLNFCFFITRLRLYIFSSKGIKLNIRISHQLVSIICSVLICPYSLFSNSRRSHLGVIESKQGFDDRSRTDRGFSAIALNERNKNFVYIKIHFEVIYSLLIEFAAGINIIHDRIEEIYCYFSL
jgi:hypothetical protein